MKITQADLNKIARELQINKMIICGRKTTQDIGGGIEEKEIWGVLPDGTKVKVFFRNGHIFNITTSLDLPYTPIRFYGMDLYDPFGNTPKKRPTNWNRYKITVELLHDNLHDIPVDGMTRFGVTIIPKIGKKTKKYNFIIHALLDMTYYGDYYSGSVMIKVVEWDPETFIMIPPEVEPCIKEAIEDKLRDMELDYAW